MLIWAIQQKIPLPDSNGAGSGLALWNKEDSRS